jgi:hypothetical protein
LNRRIAAAVAVFGERPRNAANPATMRIIYWWRIFSELEVGNAVISSTISPRRVCASTLNRLRKNPQKSVDSGFSDR